jgi:hypothetical protein
MPQGGYLSSGREDSAAGASRRGWLPPGPVPRTIGAPRRDSSRHLANDFFPPRDMALA